MSPLYEKLILVVEDNDAISDNLKDMLEVFGYRSAFVTNGKDALKVAFDLRPDLIIMDILLIGNLSGIDVAINLQNDCDIPIIFTPAGVSQEMEKTASQLGTILRKPFGMEDIMNAIKEALG